MALLTWQVLFGSTQEQRDGPNISRQALQVLHPVLQYHSNILYTASSHH